MRNLAHDSQKGFQPTLQEHGFVVAKFEVPSEIDWSDDDSIKALYWPVRLLPDRGCAPVRLPACDQHAACVALCRAMIVIASQHGRQDSRDGARHEKACVVAACVAAHASVPACRLWRSSCWGSARAPQGCTSSTTLRGGSLARLTCWHSVQAAICLRASLSAVSWSLVCGLLCDRRLAAT